MRLLILLVPNVGAGVSKQELELQTLELDFELEFPKKSWTLELEIPKKSWSFQKKNRVSFSRATSRIA